MRILCIRQSMNGGWTNEGRGERGEGEGDSGQKSITKLIAVFAVNGNGDHLLAVKPRSRFFLSLSLSLSLQAPLACSASVVQRGATPALSDLLAAANGNALANRVS
jgi:hypothetical protein